MKFILAFSICSAITGYCNNTATLPTEFKNVYGIKETKFKTWILNFNLYLLKYSRPFLPPFFRLIAPARWAKQRLTSNPNLSFKDKSKLL